MKKELPRKSFFAALEQMSQILRSGIKQKDSNTRSASSFSNALEQVAKLLRSKAQQKKTPKKTASKKVKKKT